MRRPSSIRVAKSRERLTKSKTDAHDFEAKIDLDSLPGVSSRSKSATTRIGQSILLACLRKRLVVLPLEQTVSEQAARRGAFSLSMRGFNHGREQRYRLFVRSIIAFRTGAMIRRRS